MAVSNGTPSTFGKILAASGNRRCVFVYFERVWQEGKFHRKDEDVN